MYDLLNQIALYVNIRGFGNSHFHPITNLDPRFFIGKHDLVVIESGDQCTSAPELGNEGLSLFSNVSLVPFQTDLLSKFRERS